MLERGLLTVTLGDVYIMSASSSQVIIQEHLGIKGTHTHFYLAFAQYLVVLPQGNHVTNAGLQHHYIIMLHHLCA